jgi:C4-dicarboxylate-specific signal transduction histidine kinase
MSFKASCLLDAGIINEGEKQWADARVLSVLAGGMIASGSHSRIAANIRQAATLFDRHGLYDLGALARRGSEHLVRFAVAPGRGPEEHRRHSIGLPEVLDRKLRWHRERCRQKR